MENRSFQEDSSSGTPPEDPMANPPGPSEVKLEAGPSGTTRDESQSTEPTFAQTFDKDHESPPAYVQRHMPQELKRDDLEELEQPAPEPILEPYDTRLDPEFQQQARNRRARRYRQSLVEGPCSLRPDPPNLPPLAEPEEYSDEQPDRAPTALAAPPTWQERFQEKYRRICAFSFQFPFHTLLLSWPLATACMGIMNQKACHINPFLPYVMMAVGVFGTATIVLRLYTLYFEKRLTNQNTMNYWIGVRVAESIVWVFFVAELIYFFKQAPSFNPRDKYYCKWRYYKINCGLMFMTSVTMLGWIVVHAAKLIQWIRRRNEPART